jgi:hypothetical protein
MRRFRQSLMIGLLVSPLMAVPAAAVTINPIFATSYTGGDLGVGPIDSLTGNPGAMKAIEAAARTVGGMLNQTHTTVNILFYDAPQGGFLGASLTGSIAYTYSDYVAALKADSAAHPYNITLATAIKHLGQGSGASDPSHAFVAPTTPLARALKLGVAAPSSFGTVDSSPEFSSTGDYLGGGGTVDAIVLLSSSVPLCNNRPPPSPSSQVCFDVQTTMEHEIDEVLGIGGPGSTLNDLLADPNFAQDFFGVDGTVLGSLDPYRYSSPGVPCYHVNTDQSPDSCYFSIDGGMTSIDEFNQQFMAFGDAADWAFTGSACPGGMFQGGKGYVQDAFGCNNYAKDVAYNTPERFAFEAVGYDIPEPATFLVVAGLVGAMRLRRRGALARTGRR